MSTRDYKDFSTGEHYHVFSRGNGKMDVFRDGQDYSIFLQRLLMVLGKDPNQAGQGAPLTILTTGGRRDRVRVAPVEPDAFSVAAYCLMPNHFHFLIQQNKDTPISQLFLKLLTSYSMYFNRKYDHVGHVFQDRIKAVHIENDTQLLHLSAYIHQNPKVAGLVRDLKKWPHSSYSEFAENGGRGICDTEIILEQFKDAHAYEKFVEESFEDIRARKNAMRELMIDEC